MEVKQTVTARGFNRIIAAMDYDPFAAYLLSRARFHALRGRGYKVRVLYGIPAVWRRA